MMKTLFQLVAQVESNGQTNAVRYEPGWQSSPTGVSACIRAYSPAYMNQTTAKMLCATSWGLVQIMGDNLYNMGLKTSLWDYLKSEAAQADFFARFCVSRGINYSLDEIINDPVKRANFARRYNGAAQIYGDKLLAVYGAGK